MSLQHQQMDLILCYNMKLDTNCLEIPFQVLHIISMSAKSEIQFVQVTLTLFLSFTANK